MDEICPLMPTPAREWIRHKRRLKPRSVGSRPSVLSPVYSQLRTYRCNALTDAMCPKADLNAQMVTLFTEQDLTPIGPEDKVSGHIPPIQKHAQTQAVVQRM